MRASVCIDAVGRELPRFSDRMRLVRDCGFDAVEFWGWWDKDLSEIQEAAGECSLEIAALCTRFFNPGLREERDAYLEGLRETLETARRLHCRRIISQAGNAVLPREEQTENLRETLRQAAGILRGSGVVLALEPLNPVDHPGYFLVKSPEAFQLLREVDAPEIRLLFDIYHQQVSEGNLLANILENLPLIAHFHGAGCPGRHELSGNEINYPWLLSRIDEAGYDGFIGLEYGPSLSSKESLCLDRELLRDLHSARKGNVL